MLYSVILYKGPERLQIVISSRGHGTSPAQVLRSDESIRGAKIIHEFSTAHGPAPPSLLVVQGLTVIPTMRPCELCEGTL